MTIFIIELDDGKHNFCINLNIGMTTKDTPFSFPSLDQIILTLYLYTLPESP